MAKTWIMILIVVGVIALVSGGIWMFISFGEKGTIDTVESTSDDGFATLTATFYDFSGTQPTGGVAQSLIDGTTKKTHVSFALGASNILGNVEVTTVEPISPNIGMGTAFDNVAPLSSLAIGASGISVGTTAQTCTNAGGTICDALGTGGCNTNEQCCPTDECLISLDEYSSAHSGIQNLVPFCISLQGSYKDAIGQDQVATSDSVCVPDATGYDIRGEKCPDETPILTCVSIDTLNTDQFCDWTDGSLPEIVTDCRGPDGAIGGGDDCGCAIDYVCQSDGSCLASTCSDGTLYGACSTVSKGSSCLTGADVYGAYCNCIAGTLIADFCNDCGCTDDFYNAPSTGCSAGTDPSTCLYTLYEADLEGSIGEG